jgi:hypothetical protein
LYEANLRALLPLVRQQFHQSPTLYGSLISLLSSLIDEFSSGQILTSRLSHIEQQLTQPILDALDAEFAPAQKLVEKLNSFHTAWFNL